MDTQEQEIKKSPSGRESHGVYLCRKCGWPFPKAHPSAKLRRTHKKVCGSVEGYKVVESDQHLAGSDGEHDSGEDQGTTSSTVDKAGVKELEIPGGTVLQSYSSADDVFSDAVAEFSDSPVPAIEDHIKDLNKDMDKLGHDDSVEGKSFSVGDRFSKNQSENANPCSEARIEDSPVEYIGTTSLKFDASTGASDSPVGSNGATDWKFDASPTGVLIEGIDADVKDEDINKTLTNCLNPPHVEATEESYEPYLNEIDKQASDNPREESLTPVAVLENDTPLEKDLHTENSVTEFDGNKSCDKSEVQSIFEQSGEGKDMHVSLFTKKEEETLVSNLEEENEADKAVYSLSVPDSLAAIANATHLFEDFNDYASQESSLSLDLGSSEVIKCVGDDKQSTIAEQSVPGFGSVDSSGGMYSSTIDQNTLKDDLNEAEVEKPITDESRVSRLTEKLVEDLGSCEAQNIGVYDISVWDHDSLHKPDSEITPSNESNITSPVLIENLEEITNLVVGDVPNQNKMSKTEESDEDQLAANDKETLGTDSQTTEKHGGVVEKKTEVGHESTGPTQKSTDVDFQESAFACAVKSGERNQSDGILVSSENQEASIANEVGPLPVGSEVSSQSSNMVDLTHTSQALKESPGCGSESLQGKGDDKLESRCDGVSMSTIASSRAESMDGNWGSVSVVSLPDAAVSSEKLQTDLPIHEGSSESHTVKSDDFEAPSFMTLVEPEKGEDAKTAAWFPSILDVVNESQGRKKNEEIIANWSTERKHAPLKSLLGEARSPNSKQPSSAKSSGTVTTVDAILRSEPNDKETDKEWDSPARYPVEIKKEKRKRKPYWVPFVCCSSMHRDYKQGDL